MESHRWDRASIIERLRGAVWRYLSEASATEEDIPLEAAALLQMDPAEVQELGRIQFLASDSVRQLLDGMPGLVRRLATTSVPDEERSPERVRGPIRWGATYGERAATGLPHIYVTAPAKRAFQTPENEVLVHALDAVSQVGRRTGWHRSSSTSLGGLVRARVETADKWRRARALTEIERAPVSQRTISRVRSRPRSRRYRPAVDTAVLYRDFVRRAEPAAVQTAIEQHALVARDDPVLLELLAFFTLEEALKETGWTVSRPGLVRGGRALAARQGKRELDLYYQQTPAALGAGSLYEAVQRRHQMTGVAPLRPDMVMRARQRQSTRWVLWEVKGVERSVQDSARAATLDLLAYRRAYDPVLSKQHGPYGVGVAWGRNLNPAADPEIILCSPDRIEEALDHVLAE